MSPPLRIPRGSTIADAPVVKWSFNNPRAGLIWLVPRLWLGYRWIDAAVHKVSNPTWVDGGQALKVFWKNAIAIPEAGRPPISFDWYRSAIQSLLEAEAYTWFGKVVAYGELLVGVALVIGAFTRIAAFFRALMNWSFMMAGSASTNPVLFVIAIGLMVAWKVAGHYGADYLLLPWIGTPWKARRGSPQAAEPSPG